MPRLPEPRFAPDCTIEVDGRRVAARAGESVAVALLGAGTALLARSAKYHRPRGAFCLAGSCFQCVARVDGRPSRRTCRTPCREGLVVESQNAVPTAAADLLGAVDRLYARGLDHHHLMTWNALANRAAVAASRQLAGLGHLPSRTPSIAAAPVEERFDAAVVGAGPAGLGAAEALARAGRRVLLVDDGPRLGGRLRCGLALPGDPPLAWVGEVAAAVARAGGEVATLTAAAGAWIDGAAPLLALREGDDAGEGRLRLVRAARIVLATGTWALPPLFARNDLPGVLAARGVARALAEDGVLAGARVAVSADGAEADALLALLAGAGAEALRVKEVAAARGGARLAGLELASGGRVRCDALAHAGPRAPASDLARALGAAVALDAASGGLAVEVDDRGRTAVAGLLAAGEVTRPMSAAAAAEAGRRAGVEAGA
jgi:NADPH-dependent 2,4-dienoyl-CoA reductase/sulfur reductase-like enzyme